MITAEFYFGGPFTGENADEIIAKLKSGSSFTMWESNELYMANLRERLIASNYLDNSDISLESPAKFLSDLEKLGIAKLEHSEQNQN